MEMSSEAAWVGRSGPLVGLSPVGGEAWAQLWMEQASAPAQTLAPPRLSAADPPPGNGSDLSPGWSELGRW